jgi:hypothetical protein
VRDPSLGGLVFRDYESFKGFHFDVYRRLTKSEVRPLREADIICALDLRRAVEGRCSGRRNLLVSNFFSLLHGLLTNTNTDYVNVTGTLNAGGYQLRTSGEVNYGAAYLAFGTGTGAPSFTDYALASRSTALEGASVAPTVVIGASEGRARLGRATAGTVYEVGIYQDIYDSGGNARTAMWARYAAPGGIPSGKTVLYDVVFKPPFVHNATRLIAGILANANQGGAVDVAGSTFALRTSADVNADAARRMFLGTGTAGLDHTVAVPTNPVELDAAYTFSYSYGSYYRLITTGVKKLDSAMNIGEAFLVQNLIDDGGGTRAAAIARWPISPAVSKDAGEVVSAYAIIYASA